MDNLARKESTIGEVGNLMSVDAERIESCISYLWAVWSSPLQIILSLYLLYQYIGQYVIGVVVDHSVSELSTLEKV